MLRAGLVAASVAAVFALGGWSRTGTTSPASPPARGARAAGAPARPVVDPQQLVRPRKRANAEVDDLAAFPALPPPGPSDWLSIHGEDGQTFHAWRTGPRRAVTEERRTVAVLVLDDVARYAVSSELLAAHLAACFGLPARATRASDVPDFPTRDRGAWRQTRTHDVLRWLEGEVASDAYCLLAVTSRDLYPQDSWSFVFGEASFVARVGVFSFARMHPAFPTPPPPAGEASQADRVLVVRRCLKVVTHEVGHMFGLEHCIDRRCLMNGVNHVAEMDRTPLHLCPFCLAKVVHATGVDVVDRYRRLGAVYREHGLLAEATFVDARAAALAR
jgi:archaemetzincin